MDIEQIREYCLAKKETTEGFPFGETALVFKVCGKMYALLSLDIPRSMNLKCEPEYALELRADYRSIRGGYHQNKKHWNTIDLEDSDVSFSFLKELIDHSYNLVVDKLKKADRERIRQEKT